jgi:hypothetical protein
MSTIKQLTIDDLLEALVNPKDYEDQLAGEDLPNTMATWARIGKKDKTLAKELGVPESGLDIALSEWIEKNEYDNIR